VTARVNCLCLSAQAPAYTDAVKKAKEDAEEQANAMAAAAANSIGDCLCDFVTNLIIGTPFAFTISCISEGLVSACLAALLFEAVCFSWLMIEFFPFHPQTGVPLVRLHFPFS